MAWKKILFSGSQGELSSLAVDGNITGVFQGALSSSAQIAADVSGSFVSASTALGTRIDNITSTITLSADSGTNDTYTTGETLTFEGDNSITTTVSDNKISISIADDVVSGSAQLAADISGSLSAAAIVDLGAGIVSGSAFSGSFEGNGSNLTNISVSQTATVKSDFTNQTSVNLDHNFDSRNVNVVVYNDSNVQIIPSSVTLSTTNRAVVTFDSSTSGYIVAARGGHIVSGSVSADNISGLDAKLVNLGFASTGSNTFIGNNIFTTVSGSGFSGSFQGDGSGLTGVVADGTISSSAQLAADISGSGNVRFEALNAATSSYATKLGLGIVSASVLSSPSQGTARLALNGVNTDVDLGLQTGDSPTFVGLTLTGDLEVQGTTTTIDSTTLDIGDNIVALNGTGAALGGLHINDANGPKSGSLLWDGTNNKWIGGQSGSEVDVAFLKGQGLLTGSGQIAADISGSFVAASASLASDLRTAEGAVDTLEAVDFTAGTGLTGGGTLASNRTFNVVSANNGIVANADNIELATASSTFTDGVKAKLSAEGVISSSAQIDGAFLNTTGDNVISGSSADVRTFLNVENGATADQTDAEIRTAVEAASDSNVFTDADHTKLNAIEASADVTDTANVTSAGALMDSELAEIATVKALSAAGISGSYVSASNALGTRIDNITSTITLSADSGTNDTYTTGETLTFSGDNSITTAVSDNEITISIANDVVSGSAQIAADISGSFVSASNALGARIDSISTDFDDITNKPTLISASVLSSPSQGTARLAINGVNTDVDLGLQAGDSPQFTNLTVSGDLTVTGNTFEAQVTNLNVEDRMILLNSGSTSGDVGIIFGGSDPAGDGTNNANTGSGIFWDSPTNVFGFAQDVITSAVSASVQSKIGNIETSNSNPSATPVFQGTGTTHVNESDESIWIYS